MNQPSATPGTLFRSVDIAAFCGALVQKLRTAGVEVGPTAANRLAQAMDCCPPADVSTLYWLAKTTLLIDRRDFPVFDELFEAVFGGVGLPIAPWERQAGRATVKTAGSLLRQSAPTDGFAAMNARINRTRPEVVDSSEESPAEDEDSVVPELLPAAVAELADTPFDQLSSEQLATIGRWLEQTVADLPHRRTRRRDVASVGSIDMRRTMRLARSTGEVMSLARNRARARTRPLLMVADVSGSMESFTRIYLHLMRALVAGAGQRGPSAGRGPVEVFTFATSLRRVTVQLRDRDPQAAIDRLADEVTDRFGGTRIAASIGELITTPRWSNAVRGATVLIASDGWDTEPSHDLARRMARLQRMSHRVIWVNPRSAGSAYEPAVAGMAGALPHVDRFLSGHSLRAMLDVVAALAD